jgi:hypothetical protein
MQSAGSKDDERPGAATAANGDISKMTSTSTRSPIRPKSDDNNKENDGPLRSHRDPRRTPLLSRMPFTPTPNTTASGLGASGVRGRKDVTPAYAYKSAETGLLEIRTGIPPSLSMVANEDDTVNGLDGDDERRGKNLALYPIALNGGGSGLYRDPREFGNGNAGGFSMNHRISRRTPALSHVRFAWPYEIRNLAAPAAQLHHGDLETGLGRPPSSREAVDDDDRTHRTRHSLSSLASAMNPWKLWENVHMEMSRLAALQTRRLEDEASHVTIARQRNKVSRVSSVYNDDDFDFALVLTPHDAYAFWAKHLDFREEMLNLVDDPEIEELDRDGQDDDSTIATATCHGGKHDHAMKSSATETPSDGSGLRRRKNATPSSGSKNNTNRLPSTNNTPSSTSRYQSHRSPYRAPPSAQRVFSQKKSLFERALERFSPPGLSQRSLLSSDKIKEKASPSTNARSSPSIQRRGWGNFASPPIASMRGSSAQKRRQVSNAQWKVHDSSMRVAKVDSSDRKVSGERHSPLKDSNKRTRDVSDEEDIFFPSPGIPRGVGEF